MSHTPQVAAAKTATGYDYTEVFRHFRPIFGDYGHGGSSGAEPETIAVANLETTLRTAPPYTGYPTFAAPAELAFAMREAGIDIATTANNHICDKGARGIRSTLALLDSAGIRHTGAFLDSADRRARNPLRFEAGGLRFALLAYTYGTNGIPVPRGMMVNLIDTAVIARDLALARGGEGADCVIVSYHWGEEYRTAPDRAQRELAAWTRARGADLIIGGHPHVVQPMEVFYNADSTAVTGAVYYSLGNFVSNQIRRRSDGGIVADVTLTGVDSLPLSYATGWRAAWVHTPFRGGVRRYEVLPVGMPISFAADTVGASANSPSAFRLLDTLPEPARAAALTFIHDTRALLSPVDSVFVELQ
jgi:poly-gamma-glutamate synthesis protein (capsule biosynthesis protein)